MRMQQFSLAVSRARTVEEVADALIHEGMETLEGNAASVFLLEDRTKELRMVGISGYDQASVDRFSCFPITAQTPLAETVRQGIPIYIETRQERDTRYPLLAEVAPDGGKGAIVVFPLRVDGHLLGSFGLSFATDRHFTEDDCAFLETVVQIGSLSLERSLREAATERQNERLRLLSEAAEYLLSHSDPNRIVQDLYLRVAEYLHLDVYFNYMLAPDGTRLHLDFCGGLTEEQRKDYEWLDVGVAVCGYVAETHQRYIAEEIQESGDQRCVLVRSLGVQAYCCHPLMVGDRLIGTLSFGSRSRRYFEIEDVEFLRMLCNYVAVTKERLRDMQERQQAEVMLQKTLEEIAAHRKRMDDILATVPGVVWEAWGKPDEERQRINFVSNYVEKMLGYTVEEWTGTPNFWLTIVHPDDKETAAKNAANAWASRSQHINSFRWMRKDGKAIWCESHSVVIVDEKGEPVGMRGVTMDVSDRKQVENALIEQEARYRLLLQVGPQIVYTCYPDGLMEFWNQRFVDYTGLEFGENNEARAQAITHPDDIVGSIARLQHSLQTGEPFETEYRMRRASDGAYRWFLARALPQQAADGTIIRWIGTCTDIDDMRRAYAEIALLNERLRHSMAETHHRVKNNLQVIAALLDLPVVESREMLPLSEITRLSQHVRALATVHDLLTKEAKIDGDADFLSTQAVLNGLLPLLQGLVGERHDLTSRVDNAHLTSRQATSLAMVTNELVSNAVKHGGTTIMVDFQVDGNQAYLRVSDNGPGFPPGFDPIRAAHTGLDLILNLTEWDLGGSVEFMNMPTGGGCVQVILPLPQAKGQVSAYSVADSAATAASR